MIHVYALVDLDGPAVTGTGVADAPVEVVAVDGIGVVVSVHPGDPPAPSAETALAHAAVCDGLVAPQRAVLPVRYGTHYVDGDALRAGVSQRRDAVARGLDRVRGHVEIGLRVLWDPPAAVSGAAQPAVPRAGSGRDYLKARAAEDRTRRAARAHAEQTAAVLHGPLAAAAADARCQVLGTPRLLASAAYLVPHDDVEAFTARVDELAAARPDLDVFCTGPWAPYSFADLTGGDRDG